MTTRKAETRAKASPFGNDNKKSKDESKSRFPSGMTTRKAETKATANADPPALRKDDNQKSYGR
jgi:hypothetical protein